MIKKVIEEMLDILYPGSKHVVTKKVSTVRKVIAYKTCEIKVFVVSEGEIATHKVEVDNKTPDEVMEARCYAELLLNLLNNGSKQISDPSH